MKLRILSGCLAVALLGCLGGCATTKTTRVLEDGTKVESSSYGLTDRAARAAVIGARYYFRLPSEPTTPSGK